MPRSGLRRKKKRSEKEVDASEKELKRTPRCFVLKSGKVGDHIRDLVKDFRMVMMPNCAKALRESKNNRIEDFIDVAGTLSVSHIIQFSATKLGTYMKLIKLPQGPTLTFKVQSFSLSRDIRAAQKRPRQGTRDYTSAPLQVLNGFGGPNASSERTLTAEMVRGLFPPIDVPTFNQQECRRTVLFNYDKEKDTTHFRSFSVARKQIGLGRGIAKLLRKRRVAKLGHSDDVADFVLSGGVGASDSEAEGDQEAPVPGGGKVGLRLTEVGPRMELQLIKAEDGICNGAVLYHRFQTRTPSQIEVLQAKANQRKKLKARNEKLETFAKGAKAIKAKLAEKKRKATEAAEDTAGAFGDDKDSDDEAARKKRKGGGGGGGQGGAGGKGGDADGGGGGSLRRKKFSPFGKKKSKEGKDDGGKGGGKAGKGKGGGKGGDSKGGKGKGKGGMSVMDKFNKSRK